MAYYVAQHCKACGGPTVPDIHGDQTPCTVCAGNPEAVRSEEARKAYRAKMEAK